MSFAWLVKRFVEFLDIVLSYTAFQINKNMFKNYSRSLWIIFIVLFFGTSYL